MPLLGHGLVGLGIGVATVDDARSPWVRRGWLGAAVTLAYWPDLLEWLAGLLGWSTPHSALASLPATAVSCAAVILLLRLVFKEKRWPIPTAACALIVSHMLLDSIDGGIPLWWPFSNSVLGPDWIPNRHGALGARVAREVWFLAPVAAAGLACYIWRRRAGLLLSGAAAAALQLVIIGGLTGRGPLTLAASAALVVAAQLARRRWPGLAGLWHIVPAAPVLVLAAVQVYAEAQMRLGLQYQRERDYIRAQEYYARCVRLKPIGLEDLGRHLIRVLDQRLRQEETAWQQHRGALADNPDDPQHLRALAELYLSAGDPRRRDPQEALRLAERLAAMSDAPAETRIAQRLIERARRSAGVDE